MARGLWPILSKRNQREDEPRGPHPTPCGLSPARRQPVPRRCDPCPFWPGACPVIKFPKLGAEFVFYLPQHLSLMSLSFLHWWSLLRERAQGTGPYLGGGRGGESGQGLPESSGSVVKEMQRPATRPPLVPGGHGCQHTGCSLHSSWPGA